MENIKHFLNPNEEWQYMFMLLNQNITGFMKFIHEIHNVIYKNNSNNEYVCWERMINRDWKN
jgi:hypothetical protein